MANAVFSALIAAGLRVVGNGAEAAIGAAEPRKRINATFEAWPLNIEEYSSVAALLRVARVDPKKKPRVGDPPFIFAGLNIRIEFGPKVSDERPALPDERGAAAAGVLAIALDRIIGPLSQVAAAPVALPTLAAPAPAPSASPRGSPGASPGASPTSTAEPSPSAVP